MKNTEKQNIKLASILADAEQIDVMSSFIVDPTTGAAVQYNKRFNQNKIEDLIFEMIEDIQYAIEEKYDFFNTEEDLIKYQLLLIIKHFSHFKDEIGNEFEHKIQALEALYKTGLYDLFFDEIFDQDQVADVLDKTNKTIERALIIQDEFDKAQSVKDEVVNKPKTKKDKKDNTNLN